MVSKWNTACQPDGENTVTASEQTPTFQVVDISDNMLNLCELLKNEFVCRSVRRERLSNV